MRYLLAFLAMLVASLASAVFDLQQVSRYNASGIAPTNFTRVIAKPSGGYIVAGIISLGDILLVDFDAYGSILRSQIWDSPIAAGNFPTRITLYADGKVLLLTEGDGTYLVQFSPSFAVNWEVKRAQTKFGGLDGNGIAFLAHQNGADTTVEAFDVSGSSLGTFSVAGFTMYGSDSSPSSAGGFLLSGLDATALMPCVVKVSGQPLSQEFRSVATTGTPSIGSVFNGVSADSLGGGVAVGMAYDTDFRGLIADISPTGVLTEAIDVTVRPLISPMVAGPTRVYARDRDSHLISLYSRPTGARITTYPLAFNGSTPHVGAELTGTEFGLFGNQTEPWLRIFNRDTGALLQTQTLPARASDVGRVSSGDTVAVGTANNQGFVSTWQGTLQSTLYRFSGGVRRVVVDSDTAPDGTITIGSFEDSATMNQRQSTILRYRPDGSLVFARTITLNGSGFQATHISVAPDGSTYVPGRTAANGSLALAKLSPQGAVQFTQSYAGSLALVRPVQTKALSDGTLVMVGPQSIEPSGRFVRIGSNGVVMVYRTYAEQESVIMDDILEMANGRVVYAFSGQKLALRSVDPATGDSTQTLLINSGNREGTITKDPAGNVVAAFEGNTDLRILRFRGSDMVLLNSRSIGEMSDVGEPFDIAIGPNGNTVLLTRNFSTTVVTLRWFGPGSFPTLTSAEIGAIGVDLYKDNLKVDASNVAYMVGRESTDVIYAVRYLPTGIRSAQRRLAGERNGLYLAGGGIWITGEVNTRKKSIGPFAARYSL